MTNPKILVTGGNGGIASELLPILTEKGYEVIVLDKFESFIPQKNVHLIPCDLSKEEEIINVIKEGSETWLPKLEGIVHLAGIYPNKPFNEYSSELWDYVFAVNVRSLFILIHNLLNKNAKSLKSIVITSSTASKIGSRDPAYASSKAALNGLAKNLSIILSNSNIRVNTILPGIINTVMSQNQSIARRNEHAENTLAKYIGKPEEVAKVIAFLLSNDASYIWGASIDVNGGMTI